MACLPQLYSPSDLRQIWPFSGESIPNNRILVPEIFSVSPSMTFAIPEKELPDALGCRGITIKKIVNREHSRKFLAALEPNLSSLQFWDNFSSTKQILEQGWFFSRHARTPFTLLSCVCSRRINKSKSFVREISTYTLEEPSSKTAIEFSVKKSFKYISIRSNSDLSRGKSV